MTALAPNDPRHGTTNGYSNLRCRCADCRGAWATWFAESRERRAARLAADPSLASHGEEATYSNWRCRCHPCTRAWSAAKRRAREKRRATS